MSVLSLGFRAACVGAVVFTVAALVVANAHAAGPASIAPPDVSAQRAYGYLEVLAGQIGERPAGSEAETRAVDYISKQFRSWGLDTTTQAIKVPLWHERRARLWTGGEPIVDYPAKAVVFSGNTPPEGLSGEFMDIGTASDRDLKGKDLKGKIVLIKRDVYIDYPDYWLTDKLVPMGIAGMIFYSSPGRGWIPSVYFNFKRALKEFTPPSVDIRYEDAMRLAQLRPKQINIVVEGDVEWRESHSVIGEIKGAVKPNEIVFFTAHDDTAYTSPGAYDDTGGVATVMELARGFASGPRPARTLRFVAWGGHELGLMGSEAYLRAHADDVAKFVAIVNFDGVGATLGRLEWTSTGPDAWFQFLKKTEKSLGLPESGDSGPGGTDATNFAALEVPGVQIGESGGPGASHTPGDNLQATSAVGVEDPLAFAAAVGAQLAMDPSLTFPHHFPPELLQQVRDYAARWGWGIRPEANLPPRSP